MKKVVRFSRTRFVTTVVSILLIASGIAGTFLGNGLNLGIDFKAGLNVRVQMAPVALRIAYSGDGTATLNVRGGALLLEKTEDQITTLEYSFSDYGTVQALATAVDSVDNVSASVEGSPDRSTDALLTLNRPTLVTADGVTVNARIAENVDPIGIEQVRAALEPLGDPQIQTVGDGRSQEFLVRVEEPEEAKDFDSEIITRVRDLLEDDFGQDTVLIRQSDYVGARFSRNLSQQVVYLSVLALLLILAYSWFRFHLAYAVSAIVALIHDSLLMLGFVGITGMEVSTATIAAVLTIIGYSLNDTIVIFDRIRENSGILRNTEFAEIVDTSVTQSLSRTLMTSLTTLLAVLAIFIFGTGSIKDFALALIFGVIVGTYSSVFVASPLLIAWVNTANRRRHRKDSQRFGAKKSEGQEETPAASAPGEGDATAKPVEIPRVERKQKGKRQKK